MAYRCRVCFTKPAQIKRSRDGGIECRECFTQNFEEEVFKVLKDSVSPEERVAIGLSGGKDSAALIHCLVQLNDRLKLDLQLVAIDEGIRGYRDFALECVYKTRDKYNLPLLVLNYNELYRGWDMDSIVAKTGGKQNCSNCGVLRRSALERGASQVNATAILTGHNADDNIETLLLNFLRGDWRRLASCLSPEGKRETPPRRVKPFYFSYQREVVLYAHFNQLEYFSTECTYASSAYRGEVRERIVKRLENLDSSLIRQGLDNAMTAFKSVAAKSVNIVTQCPCCGIQVTQMAGSCCPTCRLIESLES